MINLRANYVLTLTCTNVCLVGCSDGPLRFHSSPTTSPSPGFLRNKDVHDFNLLTVSGTPKVVIKLLVLFGTI